MIIGGITYVIPGWHIVPNGTTLEEVYEHWIRKFPKSEPNPTDFIKETIISKNSGKKYTVKYSMNVWECTCPGYDFHRNCSHIKEIKKKYVQNTE